MLFRVLAFMVVFFTCCPVFGQDTIFTSNNKKILSKVLEINNRDIKYKKLKPPSERIYLIDKRDVIKVIYENGFIDTLSVKLIKNQVKVSAPPRVKKPDPRSSDYFRNYAFLTVTDLLSGMISVGYERTFKSGKWSILIPVSFGMVNLGLLKPTLENRNPVTTFLPGGAYYFKNKTFSTGIEFNYFHQKQGTIKHYIGPAIEYGQYNYFVYKSNPAQTGYFNVDKRNSPFYTITIKNGILIQPTKQFNISAYFGVGIENFGYRKYSYVKNENSLSQTKLNYFNFTFGINAGYKF